MRFQLTIAVGLAGLLILAGFYLMPRPNRDAEPAATGPAAEKGEEWRSAYLNTGSAASYVGSAACRDCHEGHAKSFEHTGMGRSMAGIDLEVEPPDGAYEHPTSGRRYEIVRRDGQMWHRELGLKGFPEELVLAEFPVKYVVGSGRHSRSYFVEADGFLVESPVTWYTSRKQWGMSPGYDQKNHLGFERAAGEGCLFCHAGQSEAVERSLHRMRVDESAIGCERCHGPGSLHVAQRRSKGKQPANDVEAIDRTIVNPPDLPRDLSEAICQQCHLRSHATVLAKGKTWADYRPGLPIQDFLQNYRLDTAGSQMTVVGHVEQLHLSRCYQRSSSLTCLTCHDPHGDAELESKPLHHNAVCASCHAPSACRVTPAIRARRSPENSCVTCHMPTSDTEIPHLAFTHHRIGIHADGEAASGPEKVRPNEIAELVSLHNLDRLSPAGQNRSLALAYLEVANRQEAPQVIEHCRRQALTRLQQAAADDPADVEVIAGLARLMFDLEMPVPEKELQQALKNPGLLGQSRCNVLFLLADAAIARRRQGEALPYLRELVQLRRHPVDWLMLADCLRATGAPEIEALETSARIHPGQKKIHEHLAAYYRRAGDAVKAEWHTRCAIQWP